MLLETTNFGQIARPYSTWTHCQLLEQILSHRPQTPQILQNYEKWEY